MQTQFGFHVIKVEDKRAQAAAGLRAGQGPGPIVLLRDKYFALVKRSRDAAKVDIADPALKKGVETIENAAAVEAEFGRSMAPR